VKITSKIEDQQATIQAEDDEKEDEEKEKAYMGNKMNKAEEGEEDFPQEEENGNGNGSDEEPTDEELEGSLQKQLASLQKQIDGLDISKAVKNESENRLRKMGFKEENGLQKPQLSNSFGADETPIKKAQTVNDVVDQLTNLSYKELRKMQEYKRQGLNEGLPDEIANL
jgi:type VI protein secretion system component VasK